MLQPRGGGGGGGGGKVERRAGVCLDKEVALASYTPCGCWFCDVLYWEDLLVLFFSSVKEISRDLL